MLNTLISTNALAETLDSKIIKVEAIVKQINRTGKLVFKRTLNLSFKSSGYLEQLTIDEGDSFVRGQVLAQLDNAELMAEKNASYARLLQAKRDVKRIKTLLDKKLSSQQELDNAKTAVATTRASHKIAEYNVAKAQLIAPFNGVVLQRLTELGELQSPNQTALQLAASTNNLVVSVALTAAEVSLIRLHQEIIVNLAQFGLVNGTVSKVPAIADLPSHLFTIEVLLPDVKAEQVVVGQLAHISTSITTNDFAYRLPIAALNSVNQQGKALVMLIDNVANKQVSYRQQAFVIKKLTNKYVYLSAEQDSLPLAVVIKGWQQLALYKKEQAVEAK